MQVSARDSDVMLHEVFGIKRIVGIDGAITIICISWHGEQCQTAKWNQVGAGGALATSGLNSQHCLQRHEQVNSTITIIHIAKLRYV